MATFPAPDDPVQALTYADGTTVRHSTEHGRIQGAWENVLHHGATRLGDQDDSEFIQAAITETGWPATRGVVKIPPGRYLINDGIVIDGLGLSSTKPLTILAEGAEFYTETGSTDPLVHITNSIVSTTYVSIYGLTFYTNASSAPYRTGLKLTNAQGTVIKDCKFLGNFCQGMYVTGTCNYNFIEGCEFFFLSQGIEMNGNFNHSTITGSVFGEGLVGNPLGWIYAGNGADPTDDVTISNNHFYSPDATLAPISVLNGSGWSISGNTFRSSEVESIRLGLNGSSSGHTITGNTFYGGKQADIYVRGAQRNTITGNTFLARAGGVPANTYSAVQIHNTFGGTAGYYNVVSNNVSTDSASALDYMVWVEATSDYCVVTGNIGAAGISAAGANNQVANNITA